MKYLISLLICFSLQAQPKQYIVAPFNEFPLTAKKDAIHLYTGNWLERVKDTTFLCYIKQSVWFKRESVEVQLSVDSIRGRGDRREALVTRRVYLDSVLYDSSTTSKWMGYTVKYLHPDYGWIYVNPDSSTNLNRRWGMGFGTWAILLSMDKILGSPTDNYGWNQRPLFRIIYRSSIPDWWQKYADSLDAIP